MADSSGVFSLAGKVAVVTGAAREIGARIAERLTEQGALTVLADRVPSGGATARSIADDGGRTDPVIFDVTDSGAVVAAAIEVLRRHGANGGMSCELPAMERGAQYRGRWRRAGLVRGERQHGNHLHVGPRCER